MTDDSGPGVPVDPDTTPIVITGPSGWIGTAFLATLAARRPSGWAERVRLFGTSTRDHVAPDGTRLPVRALTEMTSADVSGAFVLHLAYLTKEKVDILGEALFERTNLEIDEVVLRALEGARAKAVFVASSGAAALAEIGRDPHLYGRSKLDQERRFLSFGALAGVPVLAGRIFNIAGPYINKLSSYAISSFLTQAFETGELRIAATTPVYRSYLHVADLCRLALGAAAAGFAPARAVDLCGSQVVEMIDIALEVAKAAAIDPRFIRRNEVDWARPSIYLGDATDTMTLAMRCGIRLAEFPAQVADTAEFIRTSIGKHRTKAN